MRRRCLLSGLASLPLVPAAPAVAAVPATVGFWHAMSGVLGETLHDLVATFNASQAEIRVEAAFKGSYPETLAAAIAAWRAGQAPHLVQMFEIGTGTMLAAGRAVKPLWQLAQETGVMLDPAAYVPAVRGYYGVADGLLASAPFNASTAMLWINRDAFDAAGLDPDTPPATWQELTGAAQRLGERKPTRIAMTSAWPVWIQFEQFAALHDIPYATQANGYDGLDAELLINAPPFVRHLGRLVALAKEGSFVYAGRDGTADPLFPRGEAAISFNSSAGRGGIARDARFRWMEAVLPYDADLIGEPRNGLIGGASLWAMTAPDRSAAEYQAVAQFLHYLALPEQVAGWSQRTGYVPVTKSGFELSRQQGFFTRNPGTELPLEQLDRGIPTANSRGIRLGRMPELRAIVSEEIEAALQGRQSAQQALDTAVIRGNRVLRDFQRSVRD